MAAGSPVLVEDHGVLALVRINRPRVRNALDLGAWRALASAVRGACSPGGPGRVVGVAGSGGFFSSGDDIRAMLSLETPGEASRFFAALAGAFRALLGCGKPTIAVVEGPAVGGGAELLLAFDYVIAERGAWLSYPEAYLGLIPPALSSLGFLALGRRAWRLAATGETLTAEEAHRLGIVDEVVEEGRGVERALQVAQRLAQIPHGVMASARRASLAAALPALEAALAELERLALTPQAKARMKAFLEGARWVEKPPRHGT